MNAVPLPRRTEGAVHGRFQPLHNGHITYIKAAKDRCDFLWVGITQYLRTHLVAVEGAGLYRSTVENNPLTYHERYNLVREALPKAGIPQSEFAIVPFPLEQPSHLEEFIPSTIPMFTAVCEEWNRVKINFLQEAGYIVEVVWEGPKEFSGQEIRRLISERSTDVTQMVPQATVGTIQRLRLWERL